MQIFVVIPAAGSSTRMGRDKLFIEVLGKSVIERTLDAFKVFKTRMADKNIDVKAVVVTSVKNIEPFKELVSSGRYDYVIDVIEGGSSRTESVWKGISFLSELEAGPNDNDVVFIHDGARCLVSQDVLDNCVNGVMQNEVCVVAVPAKNTIKRIKRIDNEVVVDHTPPRDELMEVQTPQVFTYEKIVKSYSYAISNNIGGTDDTELAERLGYKVTIIEGSYSNIKITTPEDVTMAESLLSD